MKWEKALKYTRKHKRMIAVMMAGVIGFACFYSADASVIKDAKKKKNEAQQNLDNINQQINNIQSEQSKVKSQMAAYDEQLMSLLTDMELLKTDIDNKEGEIDQAKTDLAAAQEKEQQQYADMKKRIQYMYENGDDTFLDALVESEDISDLLNRVEYVSEVYSYDRELLVAYQETVQQVADLESQLEQELADMEELKQSYDQQEASLNQVINEKKAQIADFDSQLSNAKTLASQYASTIRKQNEVIAQEQARQEKARKEAEEKAKKAAKAGTKTSNSATTASTDSGTTDSTGGSSSSNNTASTDDSDNSSSGSSSTGLTNNGLNPSYSTGVSGSSVVSYATNFVGNPYVFGGNSLTEGTDCSGFVSLVYSHFGVSLPRSSYALQSSGQAVSYENAQPRHYLLSGTCGNLYGRRQDRPCINAVERHLLWKCDLPYDHNGAPCAVRDTDDKNAAIDIEKNL